ncbi:MAG: zinc-binding alcohol dehydrogenase family protein [Castellaniella sp.]|uniref:zinc-binding alcohol dehydrogenase family protein n=1 Tax=Castellaniella sp. TaxID=1955812 RepID=UPI003C738ACA
MKAIGYRQTGPIDRPDALVDIELDRPDPGGHDVLVQIEAIAVNPVDTKIRQRVGPEGADWKVLGWDASGRVVSVGAEVSRFKPGDEVFYAGALTRPGTNSEFHLVDERIVGHKPATLDHAQAAALPLTTLTAWEMLFDRLDVRRPVPGAANAVLIIGGAGGVGSMAIQLLKALTDLTVIATASRSDTQEWVRSLGADHVVNHRQPLAPQLSALGLGSPAFVFSTTATAQHLADVVELIAPQGRFGLIDDPDTLDISGFKRKSVSVHWEFMFTRSMFGTADMDAQGRLLDELARLVDAGRVRSTLTQRISPINAENLKQAHTVLESGRACGKIVLEGF